MSSATPGEPFTLFSQKPTPATALDGWEIDVSCTTDHSVRKEKLLALVEQTGLTYNRTRRAYFKEIARPTPSFEAVCLLLIKLDNEYSHFLHVKNTEKDLRDHKDIDPDMEIHTLDLKLQELVGYHDFLWNGATDWQVERVYWMGHGGSHDPELKLYLYQRSSHCTLYSVPGITIHFSGKLLNLVHQFLRLAHDFHKLQTSLDEQVLIGRWYRPSPVSYRRGARYRSLASRSEERRLMVKSLGAVCNSFVAELTAVAKTANVPNYATLQRAETQRTWLSPSLDWVHRFLDRTKEGLTGRGMALANLIELHLRSAQYHHPLTGTSAGPGAKDVDYYCYQRLLGQNIGGISFAHVEPYFPLWQTVDAMAGVLADLLDISFQKLDTSAAGLDAGIAAYDVSEHSEDGVQTKYLGRLYLELARKSQGRMQIYGGLPHAGLWHAKTLAHPEVETLQSPYDDPVDGVHRGGSVIVRTYWASQEDRDTHLQLDDVERLFGAIGSALHVLLVKNNRVRFNERDDLIAFPVELQSMVGTVFGKLARHPAVLRRITRHPYYHDDRARDAHAGPAPAKAMPEEMIDGIAKCTQFETLRVALETLTAAIMDRKIMTIASVEDAEKFDVIKTWNQTLSEIQSVGLWVDKRIHGYVTDARTTFSIDTVPGYSYIVGEAIGLDIFTSKLAAKGIFDNKLEWARFREMILSLSPTRRPDYMAKIEEYLGRPFNQDIFADCTSEVDDQLKQQQAEFEAAQKDIPPRDIDIWGMHGWEEHQTDDSEEELEDSEEKLEDSEEKLDDSKKELGDSEKQLGDSKKELEDSEKQLKDSEEQLDDSKKQLDDSEEQLDKAEDTEEGPDDEYDVLAREEAFTA